MSKKLIDRMKVKELHDGGAGVTEIAHTLGCGKGTVSKILKSMDLYIVKSAAEEAAPAFVKKKVTASDTLALLVEKAQKELEWIEKEVPPEKSEDYREWQSQKLRVTAEIRKLIDSIASLGYKLFQAQEVSETLEIILQEVRSESAECARRIRERLERRQHIRIPL